MLRPNRVAYYIGDYWPTLPSQYQFYWEAPAQSRWSALPKHLLGAVALQMLAHEPQPELEFTHAIFPTAFMEQELLNQGLCPKQSKVIYGAIDTSQYRFDMVKKRRDSTLSLLYVGRLIHDKGVHTAIEALEKLVHQYEFQNIKLNIVGSGNREYETYLHQLVQQHSLHPFVSFLGPKPKNEIPNLYQQADIFLFTSIWQEPFGRVIVEAMASGVVVIGSATGGATELIKNEETGLVYPHGDANSLATRILNLVNTPDLQHKLAFNAHRTALKNYDIKQMTIEIESYLKKIKATEDHLN
jgi:glycosyltransferase involved in cell wall biosynthesis